MVKKFILRPEFDSGHLPVNTDKIHTKAEVRFSIENDGWSHVLECK